MTSNSLHDLLRILLSRLYAAEHQIMSILPRIAEEVSGAELRDALQCHVTETEKQLRRIEVAARFLSCRVSPLSHSGIEGLIRDLLNVVEEKGSAGVVDLALMAALRRIEFCEISSYETARSIAEALGEREVSMILEDNLREEEVIERFLTVLSEELIDEASASRPPSEYSSVSIHV